MFSQEYTGGLKNTSLALEEAQNHISTAYPSLVTNIEQSLSYLSYGGFMAVWAAISVSSWDGNTKPVRDGGMEARWSFLIKTWEMLPSCHL